LLSILRISIGSRLKSPASGLMNPSDIKEPEWIFPFDAMEVGESFFIPTLRPAEIIYALESGAKRANVRIKCYVTHKEDHLGVRAWRIR
jgi:hypothetical protein